MMTRVHRQIACLATVLSVAVAAEGQTPLCERVDGLDPDFEILLSPRESFTAEVFALAGSKGLAADSPIYQRIVTDLMLIDQQQPDIADLPIEPNPLPNGLFVIFVDAAARDRAEHGENPDFTCLNSLLDTHRVTYYNSFPETAFVRFDGVYDIGTVFELYEEVPDIVATSSNYSLTIPPNGCYYSPDGFSRVYFFEEIYQLYPDAYPIRWARVEILDSEVDIEQTTVYPPAWQAESDSCLAGELDGYLDLGPGPVTDIPTLSGAALMTLVVLLGGLALRRLRTSSLG